MATIKIPDGLGGYVPVRTPRGLPGDVGPQGEQGLQGNAGPAGIVAQANQPSDPNIIWLDTDEDIGTYTKATQEQAEAGINNDNYMTPQRVKQAIEAYSIVSDGDIILKIGGTQPSPVAGKTIIWLES